MRTNLRLFFVGGMIAFRALFNWIRPAVYIPTMLLGPIFQILLFAYMGRYSLFQDDTFFVVFNASELDLPWTLPRTVAARRWTVDLDTAEPRTGTPYRRARVVAAGATIDVESRSLVVLRRTA